MRFFRSWSWKHTDSEEQDEFDTWLASISSEEENTVTVGLYIMGNDNINDNSKGNYSYITPETPP